MKPNYEARVGLFSLIAIIMLLYGWGWLKSFTFHPPQKFTVRFHDVAGLAVNAPVQINGVRVGVVEAMDLHGKGQVLVGLKIAKEGVRVTKGSVVTIQTLGLVGAKYIEVTLPEVVPGQTPPEELGEQDTVIGEDPVRVEMIINKVAAKLNKAVGGDDDKAENSLRSAIENSGDAMKSIKEAAGRFSANLDHFTKAADNFSDSARKLGTAADNAKSVESSANTFFDRSTLLAQDLRGTSSRMNKILDNPSLSTDLKETARMAKAATDNIKLLVDKLDKTASDPAVRKDLKESLAELSNSAAHIYESVKIIKTVANDQGLRSDLKEIVHNANTAVASANRILDNKDFGYDLKGTLVKVRSAAGSVDLAAQQLNATLSQKHMLMHMVFGGTAKVKKNGEVELKSVNAEAKLKGVKTADKADAKPDSKEPGNDPSREVGEAPGSRPAIESNGSVDTIHGTAPEPGTPTQNNPNAGSPN